MKITEKALAAFRESTDVLTQPGNEPLQLETPPGSADCAQIARSLEFRREEVDIAWDDRTLHDVGTVWSRAGKWKFTDADNHRYAKYGARL